MNQLYGNYSESNRRQPTGLQRFFITCSGADQEVLSQCPTEYNKYASIGATIFLTGLLATISGGYALYSIFRGDDWAAFYAVVFGLLWGFVIFNLDRFIVSSIKKEGDITKELWFAAPRFLIALLISVVIAKPLEVRIFESRIEQQIFEDKLKKQEEAKLSIDKLNDLTKLENTVNEQTAQLKDLDSLKQGDPTGKDFKQLIVDRNQAVSDLKKVSQVNNPKIADYNFKISRINNTSHNYYYDSTGVRKGLRPEARKEINGLSYSRNLLVNEIKSKLKRVENLDTEIRKARDDYQAVLAQRISSKQSEIESKKQEKARADSIANLQLAESSEVKKRSYTNNFITQLEALGNLTAANATMNKVSWLLMLLFIVIECSPIIVKLLTKRGPYDEILERVEYEHFINQKEIISRWNSKINELLEKSKEAAKLEGEVFIKVERHRLDYELKNNQKILDALAQKQEHLANIAIEKWFQEELSKSASPQHGNHVPATEIEGKFWKKSNSLENLEYFFKNGSSGENEILILENGQVQNGSWAYDANKTKIMINLLQGKKMYIINEVTNNKLVLTDFDTNSMMEFEGK